MRTFSLLAFASCVSTIAGSEAAFRGAQEIVIPPSAHSDQLHIAFGSCYGIFGWESRIFETIAADEPDLFIWLGDVAYLDNPNPFNRGLLPK